MIGLVLRWWHVLHIERRRVRPMIRHHVILIPFLRFVLLSLRILLFVLTGISWWVLHRWIIGRVVERWHRFMSLRRMFEILTHFGPLRWSSVMLLISAIAVMKRLFLRAVLFRNNNLLSHQLILSLILVPYSHLLLLLLIILLRKHITHSTLFPHELTHWFLGGNCWFHYDKNISLFLFIFQVLFRLACLHFYLISLSLVSSLLSLPVAVSRISGNKNASWVSFSELLATHRSFHIRIGPLQRLVEDGYCVLIDIYHPRSLPCIFIIFFKLNRLGLLIHTTPFNINQQLLDVLLLYLLCLIPNSFLFLQPHFHFLCPLLRPLP